MNTLSVLRDIKEERNRQILQEGWSIDNDDKHVKGELASAAAGFALLASYPGYERLKGYWRPDWWPFDISWWKPKTRRRDLVRSAALLVAEIERLDRLAQRGTS